MATRLYHWLGALRQEAFAGTETLRVPAPLLLQEDTGLVLLEFSRGDDLRHVLARNGSEQPVRLAAQWLARLHAAAALPGTRTSSPLRETRKVDGWCDEIAPHLDPQATGRLTCARDAMRALGAALDGAVRPSLVHRDYYPANVLWDGEAVCVLDLDELRVGDPALDVGHFLAALQNLGLRAAGRPDAFATHREVFLHTYLESAPGDVRDRLPFYQAYTWLKLAAKEARRQREAWRERCLVLTGLACAAVEAMAQEGVRGR
jgi:aminoglycoside phosphotransferase (APT) family kinase protein